MFTAAGETKKGNSKKQLERRLEKAKRSLKKSKKGLSTCVRQ